MRKHVVAECKKRGGTLSEKSYSANFSRFSLGFIAGPTFHVSLSRRPTKTK